MFIKRNVHTTNQCVNLNPKKECFKISYIYIFLSLDLAKELGQDEQIIPFEEHKQFSLMPSYDLTGTSSNKSVIDIRELQFEHCLYSNNRHEVHSLNICSNVCII